MVNLAYINRKYGGPICRECLTDVYHVTLGDQDYRYDRNYFTRCPRCGGLKYIVSDISLSGRVKTLFRHFSVQ